ncbi:Rv3235 family protein [Actinomyces culturomici]|uniref:Rv3235 family protein n=1 Tax=Actinomyces culturomici TaxID=1926276 RepID=UPI000E2089F3|nr:Rv3235 family protein [Actinomyces culturomici]
MSTTVLHSSTRTCAFERRTFRWDARIDVPASQVADMRVWLASRAEGGVLDPQTPDPATWSAGLGRAIVEAVLGLREKRQLERWMVPSLFTALKHLRFDDAADGRSRRSCAPVGWRASEVAPGKVESAVVVRGPSRTYAVALRLEAFRGRWIATALEIA